MKQSIKQYVPLFLLAFLGVSCPEEKFSDDVTGSVVDINSNPIDNVLVETNYPVKSGRTNQSGVYFVQQAFSYAYNRDDGCNSTKVDYPNGIQDFSFFVSKIGYDTLEVVIVGDSSSANNWRRYHRDTIFSIQQYNFGLRGTVRRIPTVILRKTLN